MLTRNARVIHSSKAFPKGLKRLKWSKPSSTCISFGPGSVSAKLLKDFMEQNWSLVPTRSSFGFPADFAAFARRLAAP
eukprot:Skav227822  [mRNA]  locus=scaffold948:293688:295539:- [translate_table: standard]